MERLLHYVWKHQLYAGQNLQTVDGLSVRIIDTGLPNSDSGPDFSQAKIKLDGQLWAGSVEIHTKASDWYRHHHETDKAYDAVILHVTGENDSDVFRSSGEKIPQLVLTIPDRIRANIEWLLYRDRPMPCLPAIPAFETFRIQLWLDALLSERIERKTAGITHWLSHTRKDWSEVFYILLTRSFGFGINSDAFEWLARSLPLRYLQKQRASHSQVEAMLFGQAGLLEKPEACHYYRQLQKEYQFLRHKYNLTAGEGYFCRSLRTRPGNFPHVRLAQLAAIWHTYDTLFSRIIHCREPEEVKSLLRVTPREYWKNHYHFGGTTPEKEKKVGEQALQVLLINAVIPILFTYGKQTNQPEYQERALQWLEKLPPERNHIVSLFSKAGVPVRHAGDSQAVIQLKREYCEKKKCLYCRIGFQLLKKSPPRESG